MYESHHDVEIYNRLGEVSKEIEKITLVGNICESGDILASEVDLPKIEENDVIGLLDSGAYGYVMSSNYNNRLRPAEVLIKENGEERIIRRRDTFEDIMKNFV